MNNFLHADYNLAIETARQVLRARLIMAVFPVYTNACKMVNQSEYLTLPR